MPARAHIGTGRNYFSCCALAGSTPGVRLQQGLPAELSHTWAGLLSLSGATSLEGPLGRAPLGGSAQGVSLSEHPQMDLSELSGTQLASRE